MTMISLVQVACWLATTSRTARSSKSTDKVSARLLSQLCVADLLLGGVLHAEFKEFYGMSSATAMQKHSGKVRTRTILDPCASVFL